MDEAVLRFRVGVVVVAAVTITAVLVMLFGAEHSLFQPQYLIHIRFPEAPGITVDTPVRKSGVLIGRVSKVQLEEDGTVLVSARIRKKYKLRRSETCRIGTGSLFGDAVLEFVPSGQDQLLVRFDKNGSGVLEPPEREQSNLLISDDEYIAEGVVANNPLQVLSNQEDNIEKTLASIQTAGNEVAVAARSINQSIGGGDNQFARTARKAEVAIERFDQTMRSVQDLLGDEDLNARLRMALEGLPEFLDQTQQTMIEARTTLEGFQRVSDKAETNLDNLQKLTGPLGQQGETLAANVEGVTRNLNDLLKELVTFAEAMNSGQGTMGKLVYDDELYQRLDRLMSNAEELTRRIRPIVNDVRMFTDKIARDPRQLGLKGALDPRPTGLKTGVVW